MGSASRIALGEALGVLNALADKNGVGAELLGASAELEASQGLLAVFADAGTSETVKNELIEKVFAPASQNTKTVLNAVAAGRWSNASELLAGVEELGIRGEAATTQGLAEELLAIEKVISSDHELELTIGSKLAKAEAKEQLVEKLFQGKASAAAVRIIKHIVANPRARRVGRALQDFARVIADQEGKALATVTVAHPLDEAKLQKLEAYLTASEGRPVKITTVVAPEIIGGMRVRIGDKIIDGSVKSKLDDLRLKLAG